MNADFQPSDSKPIIGRIARLFFAEGRNTVEIGHLLGWHEAAVDRALSRLMDARHILAKGDHSHG